MSVLVKALLGLLIGAFFRMPILGLLISLFLKNKPKNKSNFFNFKTFNGAHWEQFMQVNYHDPRWIEGCFMSLGAFAKMRGQVHENDIQYAQRLMQRWNYDANFRRLAIASFRKGRSVAPESIIHTMSQSAIWRYTPQGFQLLSILKSYLESHHFNATQRNYFALWTQKLHQTHAYNNHYAHNKTHQTNDPLSSLDNVQWAYKILQVTEQDTQTHIKKAFRKLMSQHHPDRNQNDPQATKKTQDVQKAYSILKEAKGWA